MPRRLHHPPYPTLQELRENKGDMVLIDIDVDSPWVTTVEGVKVAGVYKDAMYLEDGSIVPWIADSYTPPKPLSTEDRFHLAESIIIHDALRQD